MEQPSSPELPFENIDLSSDMSQHWRLRDIQQNQAVILKEEGIIVNALLQAQYIGKNIPEDSAYWACVFRRMRPYSDVALGGGVRFTGERVDNDHLEEFIIDVPVYDLLGDTRYETRPFDDREAALVADMLTVLELEQVYGDLPNLGADLASLPRSIP